MTLRDGLLRIRALVVKTTAGAESIPASIVRTALGLRSTWITVGVLRLRKWQLMPTSVELVTAVLEPVGPRDQHLAPTTGRHRVDPVAVDDVAAID
jgi:hypothetical protein